MSMAFLSLCGVVVWWWLPRRTLFYGVVAVDVLDVDFLLCLLSIVGCGCVAVFIVTLAACVVERFNTSQYMRDRDKRRIDRLERRIDNVERDIYFKNGKA